jgi:hypothetical protein
LLFSLGEILVKVVFRSRLRMLYLSGVVFLTFDMGCRVRASKLLKTSNLLLGLTKHGHRVILHYADCGLEVGRREKHENRSASKVEYDEEDKKMRDDILGEKKSREERKWVSTRERAY